MLIYFFKQSNIEPIPNMISFFFIENKYHNADADVFAAKKCPLRKDFAGR